MTNAQHIHTCKILLHPTACTRAGILMLQHRTGLLVITSSRGLAQAVPAKGAA
ncbi:hypothetical protein [Pseudomonas japonica]|uniref:hypothetical protein n=1 Tax=Pseudomonas japonica TaxID=256466 RepID=UPI003A87DB37